VTWPAPAPRARPVAPERGAVCLRYDASDNKRPDGTLELACWHRVPLSAVSRKREELLKAARRREVDAIVVWKLDRWGRSLPDLISSLAELRDLRIAFVSLTEALDFTTSAGRAMVGLLSVFAEFERDMIRERVKAGIAQARSEGKQHGRPQTASKKIAQVKRLYRKGRNKSEIARELKISRGSVINMLK
jgi:putative DNA-invertase from lambdoid prophage Rac